MQNQNELDALAEELTLQCEVDRYGTVRYYNSEGQLHRIHGPATIFVDGTIFWYLDDIFHRLNGPAAIWSDGDCGYFINGVEYSEEEFNAHPLVIAYAKSKS